MSKGLMFWIIMLVGLIFGGWWGWPNRTALGVGLVIFIAVALIGWQVFGPPIK